MHVCCAGGQAGIEDKKQAFMLACWFLQQSLAIALYYYYLEVKLPEKVS